MTTRADVKINGDYEWIEDTAPTTSEKAPDYSGGDRWLDTSDGNSYVLTDETAGTWTRTERALDNRIDRDLQTIYDRILGECFTSFMRQRQIELEESPDTITRTALYYLTTYVSLYALWTISGASISVDDEDDIIGTLEDLEYEDVAYVYGSKRNDGYKTIASIDAAGVTFDQTLEGTEADRFMVALLDVPEAFDRIVGRMVYYDVTVRNSRLGLETERIGTYSYTTGPTVGGVSYPADVAAGIESFMNSGPIADAEYVP